MEYLEQEKAKWQDIRTQLLQITHNRYMNHILWRNATNLFKTSLSKKYMKPIKIVKRRGERSGEGYLIVSSLVILIEVLAGFRKGLIYKRDINDRSIEYNDSKGLFMNFLKSNEIFSNVFANLNEYKNPNSQDIYEDFYHNVRCNLVHGGRFNSDWTISTKDSEIIDDEEFIKVEDNKKVIYRNIFITVIDNYIEKYIADLNENEREYNDLRKRFARRFDWHFNEDYTVWL